MEPLEYSKQFSLETFTLLFAKVLFIELLVLALLIILFILLFRKSIYVFRTILEFIGLLFLIDIIHTGISLQIASNYKYQYCNSHEHNYPSIYKIATIYEDVGRIDTFHTNYLNIYGLGPKVGDKLLEDINFLD